MQKLLLVAFITAAGALLLLRNAAAAGNGWGVWTNSERTHIYAFLKNNELKFWGQKSTWRADTQRNTYTQAKTDGVWQYQEGMCWLGDKKQQQGNVMIYVDTLQCCMSAQFLGNKLVLSEVWEKGYDEYGVCINRVLTKTTMPSE
jgi:hypothetical protein